MFWALNFIKLEKSLLSPNLSILFGDKVNKTKSSVITSTSSLFWKTNCLQLSKSTEMTEKGMKLFTLSFSYDKLFLHKTVVCLCANYQKSSRSSLTEAWNGTLRTRSLVPVCFFPNCFFFRDTSDFLCTGDRPQNHPPPRVLILKQRKPLTSNWCLLLASDTLTFRIKDCLLQINSCILTERTLHSKCISRKFYYTLVKVVISILPGCSLWNLYL